LVVAVQLTPMEQILYFLQLLQQVAVRADTTHLTLVVQVVQVAAAEHQMLVVREVLQVHQGKDMAVVHRQEQTEIIVLVAVAVRVQLGLMEQQMLEQVALA
jgi:hypothetical protein